MAIVPKTKVIQLRVDPELFDKFSARADANDTTVSAMIRGLMNGWLNHVERRERKDSEWAATLESRRQAVSASPEPRKPPVEPVEPVRKPGSLSERMKADREAKKAKKQKREDRF